MINSKAGGKTGKTTIQKITNQKENSILFYFGITIFTCKVSKQCCPPNTGASFQKRNTWTANCTWLIFNPPDKTLSTVEFPLFQRCHSCWIPLKHLILRYESLLIAPEPLTFQGRICFSDLAEFCLPSFNTQSGGHPASLYSIMISDRQNHWKQLRKPYSVVSRTWIS